MEGMSTREQEGQRQKVFSSLGNVGLPHRQLHVRISIGHQGFRIKRGTSPHGLVQHHRVEQAPGLRRPLWQLRVIPTR